MSKAMLLPMSSQRKTDKKSRRIKRARMVMMPLARAPKTKELLLPKTPKR